MKKLLFGLIGIMLFLSLIQIISGESFIGQGFNDNLSSTVNGTTSGVDIDTDTFNLSTYEDVIGWLWIVIAIGVGLGIAIFGSGLSESSIKLAYKAIFYGTVWGILSILPIPMLFSIELFGGIIYISATILYVIAVITVID